MEFPQKIKNRTTIQSSYSTSEYFLKETKTLIQNDTCTPIFIVAVFTIAKIQKQQKGLSLGEWIKDVVDTYETWQATVMALQKNQVQLSD